jgi:hypothetical protein
MATLDMVWIGFGQATEVMIVASEALPSCRVGKHLVEIDTSPWQDWPWQPATVLPGESVRGWFKDRDEKGRLLFLSGGSVFYLFHVRDVTILRYGPEADLSLAWDINGGQGDNET